MRRYLLLVLAMMLLLTGCHHEEVPVDESPTPAPPPPPATQLEEPTSTHIQEWGSWEYNDPNISVPTREPIPSKSPDEVPTASSAPVIPHKPASTGTVDIDAHALELAIKQSSVVWATNGSNRYACYGLWNEEALDEALKSVGLSIKECPMNSVTTGPGYTCTVSGESEGRINIVVVFEED